MTPSRFWKTPGYTIDTMKPRPTENEKWNPSWPSDPQPPKAWRKAAPEELESIHLVKPPNFCTPIAPHTTPRNVIRFPSGLEVEDMTDRDPRPLWPLVVSALLIWAAVAGCAYYLAA